MFRIPKILVEKIQKTLRTLNYVRQTNRETKENQRDKKGKMLLLFNKVGKVIILVRSSIFVSVYRGALECLSTLKFIILRALF